MNKVRLVFSAIIITIVSYIIHTIGALINMNYYLDQNYFSIWSKLMMPSAGPPPLEFTVLSLLTGFIFTVIFVFFFSKIRPLLKNDRPAVAGIKFGLGVFLLGTLPGMFTLALLINIQIGLVVGFTIEGLAINVIGGIIAAKLMK